MLRSTMIIIAVGIQCCSDQEMREAESAVTGGGARKDGASYLKSKISLFGDVFTQVAVQGCIGRANPKPAEIPSSNPSLNMENRTLRFT